MNPDRIDPQKVSRVTPGSVSGLGVTALAQRLPPMRPKHDHAQRRTATRVSTLVIATPLRGDRWRWVERLRRILSVFEADDWTLLERVMANLKPDVLVVDLRLPGLDEVRGLIRVPRVCPFTKIIALTDTPTDREGVSVLKAGAKGYCARSTAPQQLEKAIAAVQKGEIWAPRRLVHGVVAELLFLVDNRSNGLVAKPDPRLNSLTQRQRVIADLISRGACNKEVAQRLNITERTVKAHLTAAFRNVGVSDRLQLALLTRSREMPGA
jgi:two-component system nitrate/nitrite response regulator NarL